MSDITGVPQDESVTYADPQDIVDVLRSFEFDAQSNPTESQVNRFIENKTRNIEKEIPTSFRTLELTDYVIDVDGSSRQKRSGIQVRSGAGRQRSNFQHNTTTDKWIKIQLPHYFIQSLDELVLLTSTGEETIELNDSEEEHKYRLNKREGVLRVDYREFPPTASGTAGEDRLIDSRVKVSYTYGRDFIDDDITEACAKMVVYDLINSDAFSELRDGEDAFIDLEVFTERIKEDADEILERYKY